MSSLTKWGVIGMGMKHFLGLCIEPGCWKRQMLAYSHCGPGWCMSASIGQLYKQVSSMNSAVSGLEEVLQANKPRTPIHLDDLDVIGFSSVIEKPTLPRVLAPIFRDRTAPDVVIFPPLSIKDGKVIGGHIGNQAELNEFAEKGKVTCLHETLPFPARRYFDLWVDSDGTVVYTAKKVREKAFADLYIKHSWAAWADLVKKKYDEAYGNALIARSVGGCRKAGATDHSRCGGDHSGQDH